MATERLPFSAPGTKLEGDREVALQLLPRARELLFQVKQVSATADAPIFSMTRRLEDGSWYRASVYDGIERVRVYGAEKEPEPVTEEEKIDRLTPVYIRLFTADGEALLRTTWGLNRGKIIAEVPTDDGVIVDAFRGRPIVRKRFGADTTEFVSRPIGAIPIAPLVFSAHPGCPPDLPPAPEVVVPPLFAYTNLGTSIADKVLAQWSIGETPTPQWREEAGHTTTGNGTAWALIGPVFETTPCFTYVGSYNITYQHLGGSTVQRGTRVHTVPGGLAGQRFFHTEQREATTVFPAGSVSPSSVTRGTPSVGSPYDDLLPDEFTSSTTVGIPIAATAPPIWTTYKIGGAAPLYDEQKIRDAGAQLRDVLLTSSKRFLADNDSRWWLTMYRYIALDAKHICFYNDQVGDPIQVFPAGELDWQYEVEAPTHLSYFSEGMFPRTRRDVWIYKGQVFTVWGSGPNVDTGNELLYVVQKMTGEVIRHKRLSQLLPDGVTLDDVTSAKFDSTTTSQGRSVIVERTMQTTQ